MEPFLENLPDGKEQIGFQKRVKLKNINIAGVGKTGLKIPWLLFKPNVWTSFSGMTNTVGLIFEGAVSPRQADITKSKAGDHGEGNPLMFLKKVDQPKTNLSVPVGFTFNKLLETDKAKPQNDTAIKGINSSTETPVNPNGTGTDVFKLKPLLPFATFHPDAKVSKKTNNQTQENKQIFGFSFANPSSSGFFGGTGTASGGQVRKS